jgi:hypothetical protein
MSKELQDFFRKRWKMYFREFHMEVAMNDFELFSKSQARTSDQQPVMTFQKGGRAFALNRSALEKLGSPEFIQLFYSKSRHAVGIKAAQKTDSAIIPVRTLKAGTTSLIAAKAFTTTYRLGFSEAIRANLILEGDMFIAEIPKEISKEQIQENHTSSKSEV